MAKTRCSSAPALWQILTYQTLNPSSSVPMSEYQYLAFLAIDRLLDEKDRAALRAMSSRAEITTTAFTNHYEWGDFKGDPKELMTRWFDFHLYFTNWGTRRLMIRFPVHRVDRRFIEALLHNVSGTEVWTHDGNLIVDICREEVEADFDDWEHDFGCLALLVPLRDHVLSGDMRVFYLAWLIAVEEAKVGDDAIEPLPGIGELTGPLEAFADFFEMDPDLVIAAVEHSAIPRTVGELRGHRGALAAARERKAARKAQRNAADRNGRPRKPGLPGSMPWHGAAQMPGRMSRRQSNAATLGDTIPRSSSLSTSRKSLEIRERRPNSPDTSRRSVSGTSEKSGLSSGWPA